MEYSSIPNRENGWNDLYHDRSLPIPEYISRIISKRPHSIFIIASYDARENAQIINNMFPNVHIALHPKMNAKVVFVAPETVWVSSSDFGETKMVESAVGLHSVEVHNRRVDSLFNREWQKSIELYRYKWLCWQVQ